MKPEIQQPPSPIGYGEPREQTESTENDCSATSCSSDLPWRPAHSIRSDLSGHGVGIRGPAKTNLSRCRGVAGCSGTATACDYSDAPPPRRTVNYATTPRKPFPHRLLVRTSEFRLV